MRIDPDFHLAAEPDLTDEERLERRDQHLFEDILTAVVICCATLLIVAPLFVAYWLVPVRADAPVMVPALAEDDCGYFHKGRALKDVVRVGDHVECRYY